MINADERILKEKHLQIVVTELASSVNFKVRVWVKAIDYRGVFFDLQKGVKKAVDRNIGSIPFPQLDVHTR